MQRGRAKSRGRLGRLLPSWLRGLTPRIAALVFVVLLLFDQVLSPRVYDAVLDRLGLPQSDEHLHYQDLSGFGEPFLDGAERASPGRWLPSLTAVQDADQELRQSGMAFVWLDVEGRVVESTVDGWQREDVFAPSPTGLFEMSAVDADGERYDCRAISGSIEKDDEAAGTLVLALVDRATHAASHGLDPETEAIPPGCQFELLDDEQVFASEEDLQAALNRSERLLQLTSIAVIGAIAVLLSLFVSYLVTRRLRRLARVATAPIQGGHDLPGPFPEQGGDEIAELGTAMNEMRGRVQGLLEQVSARERERREWIAQVSHDLRTPLMALLACLDRARTATTGRTGTGETTLDASSGSPATNGSRTNGIGNGVAKNGSSPHEGDGKEDLQRLLDIARMDAARVQDLADDLLDIARMDTLQTMHREPVPPGEIARQSARGMRPLAETRGIALEVDVERGLPVLEADGRLVQRALENLLKNALHFADGTVALRVFRRGEHVCFEALDDGPGFRPDTDPAFKPTHSDSAGLGLRLAQRVAEAHGGQLTTENDPDGGARVSISVLHATE